MGGRHPKGVRWVFFDVGNTLVNEKYAQEDRARQLVAALALRGQSIKFETVMRTLEEGAEQCVPSPFGWTLERLVADTADRDYVRSNVRYRKELEVPFPDAGRVLQRLSHRYQLGIVANQPVGTGRRLAHHGLMRYISGLNASAEEGIAKPDPAIFELALSRAGCTPSNAVMIGDRLEHDIAPAKALGMMTIHVRQGIHRGQRPRSPEESPDHSVSDIRELPALFVLE